ncbi:hypothetical protein Dda_2291 [Drechslerella dactyloides]|uniref:Actin cortical patch SUR7/pH-response regulator PalI n=1 Tax=Drechslerella dactyloides TaxID=74499 RepID=A0AAD6J448_DREDA|nr:hypothetical protein Dda_2291 [Drechslerella dactyloides]
MGKHTFAIFHFSATAGLFISFVLLVLISLSGPTWHDFSLLTVGLKDGSAFEAIPFSRGRNSYATYGTFGYCIQHIELGEGYQERSCSDPTVGYPITEVQTAIDGTKFFENNKDIDSLTKVMVLHPVAAATSFLACVFSIRSGYLLSIGSMTLTLVSWLMITVAMAMEWYIFTIVQEHVNSREVGGGSKARFGAALWCLTAAFLLLTFGTVVMSATVWKKKSSWWRGRARGRQQTGQYPGSSDSSPSKPELNFKQRFQGPGTSVGVIAYALGWTVC